MTPVNLVSPDGRTQTQVEIEGIEPDQYAQVSEVLGREMERETRVYVGVSAAMQTAINLCPNANPADLWVHLIYHQFRNRFLRADQSWKRVSGQAFEQLVTTVYQPRLAGFGIFLRTSTPADAVAFGLTRRGFGSSKTDLVLEGVHGEQLVRFGVIHCKASIAERLTDDAPVSMALRKKGFWSAIVTMDAKMFPPPHGDGIVRGELGLSSRDKRRYFEVGGQFSGCYSFNLRTPPSPAKVKSGCRIHSLPFTEEQPDVLVRDIAAAWQSFRTRFVEARR